MSVAQLVRRVGQLGLGLRSPCQLGLRSPLLTTSPLLTSAPSCLARGFQLSCVRERHLDSRRRPIYKKPSVKHGRWVPLVSPYEKFEYTTEPIPTPSTGGRGPNGRIWNHRRGGGDRRDFIMICKIRAGPDKSVQTLVERVVNVVPDVNRSAHIALVAGGTRQRWIIATACMKEGDVIRSSRVLTSYPVVPREGDSYPLGSLPVGTMVSCLEVEPDGGILKIISAGTSGFLVQKQADGRAVVRLPSKRELILDERCAAAVGQVSNVTHEDRILGTAGAKRRLGIRPRSGRWHRKGGRQGRKIYSGPRAPIDETKPKRRKPRVYEMTLD